MLRRLLCILLTLCLLLGYAAAEDSATATPTQEPPAGALVNGMVDGAGETAVQELQERLIALGLLTGAADGHFGDGTEEAVKLFQQMYGLEATGYADEATLSALSTAQEGVLEVQEGLIAAGVSSGEADGVLGEATEEAIATFQQMFGLEATGVADPETRELLASSSNVIFGVQTKLIELAYLTGVADGVLGPATETAISGVPADAWSGSHRRGRPRDARAFAKRHEPDDQAHAHALAARTWRQGHGYRARPAAAGRVGLPRRLGGRPLRRRYRGRGEGIQDLPVRRHARLSGGQPHALAGAHADPHPRADPDAGPGRDAGGVRRHAAAGADRHAHAHALRAGRRDHRQPAGLFKADSFDVYRETVRNGDKGTEVERVQRRLHQLNYLYSADGAFGNLTENALKYFQRKNNLDQTGVADEETQRLLFSPDAIESEEYVFPYKLVVDLSDRRTYVYRWTGDGYNERIATFKCCVGAPKTPTPQGTFQGSGQAGGRWYYFKDFNCYAQYAWRIQGGILFHSVTYSRPNENSGGSTRSLGRAESHGCVRLTVSDAKWIYDNCPMGTTVVVQA